MLSVEKTLKQEIEQWKHEYEVLDVCCELAQGKIAELKAENDRLEEEKDGMQILIDNYITLTEKYHQTLQEIKAIAEKPKPFKDFSEIKTATEVEYDYATICNELELRLHKVLELITNERDN